MNKHRIRLAAPTDAKAISQLMIPVVKKYVCNEYSKQGEQIIVSSMSAENILTNINSEYRYTLAEINKKLVGVLGIKTENHIFHCFVDEKYHRQNIGQQLWHHWLNDANASRVTVNSSKYAIKFYQSLGFIAVDEQFEKKGVVYHPMILQRTPI